MMMVIVAVAMVMGGSDGDDGDGEDIPNMVAALVMVMIVMGNAMTSLIMMSS